MARGSWCLVLREEGPGWRIPIAPLDDLTQTPETPLALEPEELALLVLREVIVQEKQKVYGPPQHCAFSQRFRGCPQSVQRAIMEAWAWLESSGCLAQRTEQSAGVFFVTRRGHELAQSSDTAVFTRESTLPRHLLHPIIEQKVWSNFIRGQYDSAVFEAFKQVEVALRGAGGFADSDLGVGLARKAFRPAPGPLTDKTVVTAEQEALSNLVAGAMGSSEPPEPPKRQDQGRGGSGRNRHLGKPPLEDHRGTNSSDAVTAKGRKDLERDKK